MNQRKYQNLLILTTKGWPILVKERNENSLTH